MNKELMWKKSFFLHLFFLVVMFFSLLFGFFSKDSISLEEQNKTKEKFNKDIEQVDTFEVVEANAVSEKDLSGALEKIRSEKIKKESIAQESKEKELAKINNLIKKAKSELESKKRETNSKENLALDKRKEIESLNNNLSALKKQIEIERQNLEKEKKELAKEESELKKKYKEIKEKNRVREINRNRNNTNELIKYKNNIMEKVESVWLKPSYARRGWDCTVSINQNENGYVIGIKVKNCVNDKAFETSVINAVRESSPLPLPKNKKLFDNKIDITFYVD